MLPENPGISGRRKQVIPWSKLEMGCTMRRENKERKKTMRNRKQRRNFEKKELRNPSHIVLSF
jgi:hypothetical protein